MAYADDLHLLVEWPSRVSFERSATVARAIVAYSILYVVAYSEK